MLEVVEGATIIIKPNHHIAYSLKGSGRFSCKINLKIKKKIIMIREER